MLGSRNLGDFANVVYFRSQIVNAYSDFRSVGITCIPQIDGAASKITEPGIK